MEREQIIKALECCASEECVCAQCPIDEKIKDDCECGKLVAKNALYLIKELTVELDAMRGAANSYKMHNERLTEENERLRAEREAAVHDLRDCMYYAKPKRANTCNFCIHDCEVSKDGTKCKGKDDWIYCSPVWRGIVKAKAEGE